MLDSSSPCDPSGWVKKAQKVAQTGSLSDACGVLKQGLLSFPASEVSALVVNIMFGIAKL